MTRTVRINFAPCFIAVCAPIFAPITWPGAVQLARGVGDEKMSQKILDDTKATLLKMAAAALGEGR